MALTRRDGYATLFVGAGLLLALSVIQGWGWPLMNGTRMGIIALGAAGMFACSVSGWAGPNVSYANPFMIIGILLGVIALGAAVGGLVLNTTVYLTIMLVAVVLLWLVTVVHRLVSSTSSRSITAT